MASVDFAKFKKASECKAMLRHCDAVERVANNHSNPNINKELTASNGAIKGLTYSEVCAAYDRRIAALDAAKGANKRKDRVTLLGLDVPRPAGLRPSDQDAWFRRVWDITAQMYGTNNMLEGYIHRDEVHTYLDPATKQEVTSREHLHMFVIPERKGRLCAKECCSRASMIQLNNSIQSMTTREFGVLFMDGSKAKSTKTVEQLRNESCAREIEEKARENAQKIVAEARAEAQKIRETADKRLEAVTEALKHVQELEQLELDVLQRMKQRLQESDIV